jgi:hypothetical protein
MLRMSMKHHARWLLPCRNKLSLKMLVAILISIPTSSNHPSNGAKEKDKVYNFKLCDHNYQWLRLLDCASEKGVLQHSRLKNMAFYSTREPFETPFIYNMAGSSLVLPVKAAVELPLLLILPWHVQKVVTPSSATMKSGMLLLTF